eukprot:CAMPEP_0179002314 /NCGR_PEP_ID=MMETSP0795-20121207/11928_1 /TAXON_ID=88552 /ORGANISM="Amoebophrya sp., Strain Ameob2" /LENGTH=176 /DNA_ID=CAMNT_0020695947 /DNA_START=3 /DNA_END=530 /DNA_ORIENTATION=-
MDYGYHGYYTPNRLQWQDELIKHVVTKTEPIHRPWLIYSCGAMGAGKGHVMRWLTAQNFIPMEKAVRIDPDVFKAVMPEFDGYVGIDKFRSGTYCHTESGAIQEIALEASLRMSQNIWVDGSLRNTEWYREQIQDVATGFRSRVLLPGYFTSSRAAAGGGDGALHPGGDAAGVDFG